MAYGLQFFADNGNLTIDSEAMSAYYIGKATYLDDVITSTGGYIAAKRYTITHSGLILPFLPLTTNHYTGIINAGQVGSTWTITVVNGRSDLGAQDPYGFFLQQETCNVYVFGQVMSLSGTYGLALYNSSGVLSFDASRNHLLNPQAMMSWSSSLNGNATIAQVQSMPVSLTTPCVFGHGCGNGIAWDGTVSPSVNHKTRAIWSLQSGGSQIVRKCFGWDRLEEMGIASSSHGSLQSGYCILLDGSVLP